jgi:hypothetical protein
VVLGRGFAGLDRDLFRGRDRFLGFLCQHAGGRGPSFFDEPGRLSIRLRHHFLALSFGPGELGLYALGVGHTQSDLLTSHFQHREDGSIGKPVKDRAHDAEADDLGEQMRPVHAEGRRNPFDPAIHDLCLRRREKEIQLAYLTRNRA